MTRPATASVARVEPDVQFENVGSFALATPRTAAGKRWLRRHTDADATWYTEQGVASLVVEFRFLESLVPAMRAAGLVVRG